MALEAFVQEYGETLQYVLFFGLLALLGLLEAVAPGWRHPVERGRRWPPNFVLTALNILVLGALPVTGIGIAALVTPDLHRVHHSARWPETDRNYGVVVPWWDRLFGTYQAGLASGAQNVRLGLDEVPAASAQTVGGLLLLPLRRPLRSSRAV